MKHFFVIGIIVCDKDFVYLTDLIKNIKDNAIGNYTVIIYNNCETNYDLLQSAKIDNAIILPNTYKHKNSRQIYARKMITNKAYEIGSEYIWFIDADDHIHKKVDFNNITHYTDIIVFPYLTDVKDEPGWIPFHDDRILSVELTPTHADYIERPLWCKFIKTNIYFKAYELIDAENLPPISCSEDTIASLLAMKFAKTFSEYKEPIYYHSTNRSNSESPETHFNDIEQSTIGIREILIMLDTLFTKEEYDSLRLDLTKFGTISWVIGRICTITDNDELKKTLKAFNKKLGQKYIKQYLNYVKKDGKFLSVFKENNIEFYRGTFETDINIVQIYDNKTYKIFHVVKGIVHAVALANNSKPNDKIICLDDESYNFLSLIGYSNLERKEEILNVYHSKIYYLIQESIKNPGTKFICIDSGINFINLFFKKKISIEPFSGIILPRYNQIYNGAPDSPIANIMIAQNCDNQMLEVYYEIASKSREYYHDDKEYYKERTNNFGTEEQILGNMYFCKIGDERIKKIIPYCMGRYNTHHILFENILKDNSLLNLNYYEYIKDYPKDKALLYSQKNS